MHRNRVYLIKPTRVMSATNAMVFYSRILPSVKEQIMDNGGIWKDYFKNNQDYLLVSIPEVLHPIIIKELKYLDSVQDVTEQIETNAIKTEVLNNFELDLFKSNLNQVSTLLN